jgi:flagellar hook-length control protein FliK
MGRTELDYGRFFSRFLVTVIPAAMASGVAVYVLYAIHVARAPNPADQLTLTSPLSDGLSTDERRELTRQMLKERRENPQVPAEVRPTPRPPSKGAADNGATGSAPVRTTDVKARPERTAATSPVAPPPAASGAVQPVTAPLPTARPNAVAGRSDPAQVPPAAMGSVTPGAAPAPPVAPGAGAAPPPPAADPTTIPPAAVNTAPAGAEPESRGLAANVFSSISVFAGTAANATGNTVNWVIDLPGKAISAGGRLFSGGGGGGDSAAATPPPAAAPTPPPAAAPAPPAPAKRN